MNGLSDLLDESAAALKAAEPYFSERIDLARRYVTMAQADDGGLHYPDGYVAGPCGCTCTEHLGGLECIHVIGWRLLTGGR